MKKSVLETSYLLLGAFFGILLTMLVEHPLLFYGVEAFVAVSVIAVLATLARYRKRVLERARELIFEGVRGVTAGIAGSIFGIGYTVLVLDWLAGVVFFGLTFVLVAIAIDLTRTIEGATGPKNIEPKRPP